MIIIFTINCDPSSSLVIDWIHFFNKEYLRINEKDFISDKHNSVISISNDDTSLQLKFATLAPKKKIKVWLRKIITPYINPNKSSNNSYIGNISSHVASHLNEELNAFIHSIYHFIEKEFILGTHLADRISKIKMLNYAKKSKLYIPDTIITNNKKDLIKWSKKHTSIIIKSLQNGFFFRVEEKSFGLYTEKVEHTNLDNLPENFLPCICQEFIDKQYDIRIFYLLGVCYSMVIFSQLDQQTSTDFRKYNLSKPTRKVPFKLPKNIEVKICDLMVFLELNTGSIDMIRDKKGRYIFLEVNPSGQFGFLSQSCNYYLEEKIANFLSYE